MSLPESLKDLNISENEEQNMRENSDEETQSGERTDKLLAEGTGEYKLDCKTDSTHNSDGEVKLEGSIKRQTRDVEEKANSIEENNPFSVEDSVAKNSEDILQKPTAGRKKELKRKDLKLPKDFQNKMAFALYNVFTDEECREYIRITEEKGYELALVNVGGGRQCKMTDVRNSSRCIWDSDEEAGKIWERIKDHIPERVRGRKVLGLNERLRFLRYDPGEYFKPHMDGMYMRTNGERSFITIQMYLNEGFKGGSTTFMDYNMKNRKEVVPKTGMILVFDHDIMHEGSELIKGRKYSMRTDVMYSASDHL